MTSINQISAISRHHDTCRCGGEKDKRANRCRACKIADNRADFKCPVCGTLQRLTLYWASVKKACSPECAHILQKFELSKENLMAHCVTSAEGCWQWTGTLSPCGYGMAGDNRAHRVSYQLFKGPIPSGMEIDHLCHTNDPSCRADEKCLHRRCINPDHLEAVTRATNQRRGRGFAGLKFQQTSCVHGHPFDEVNTWISKRGRRHCRECHRIRERSRRRSITQMA